MPDCELLTLGLLAACVQIISEASDSMPMPSEAMPLVQVLNDIEASAAEDPRKFSGFGQKHWHPQNVLDDGKSEVRGSHTAAPPVDV